MAFRGRPPGQGALGGAGAEQLQEELREKTLALVSVQRNYEGLSRMMQMRQQELEQVRSSPYVLQQHLKGSVTWLGLAVLLGTCVEV